MLFLRELISKFIFYTLGLVIPTPKSCSNMKLLIYSSLNFRSSYKEVMGKKGKISTKSFRLFLARN